VAVAADGTRTHRQVVATITGHGAKDLVGLTLVGSGGGGPPGGETITATGGHLFLTADGAWVPAKDLQVGDRLVDPDGTPVTIGAVERDSVVATVHNLTVDTDHTYTVVTTDGTDVVTHNDDKRRAMGAAQEANACPLPGADANDLLSKARAARDEMGRQMQGLDRYKQRPAVFVGAYDEATGKFGAFASEIGGRHAEEVARAAMPNARLTEPMGWRQPKGASSEAWQVIPVCARVCQPQFGPGLFPAGTPGQAGGAWGR